MTSRAEEQFDEEECSLFYEQMLGAIQSRIGKCEAAADDGQHAYRERPAAGTSSSEATGGDQASVEELLEQYKLKDLRNLCAVLGALKRESINMVLKTPCSAEDYLRFLGTYGARSAWDCNTLEGLSTLLGPGSDPAPFEAAASRIFGALFCMQSLPKVTFYELSLLSNLQRTHFKNDRHVGDAVSRICRSFVDTIARGYAASRPYAIARERLNEFSRKIESYVNAFNGLVNELHVDQSLIPKIVFVLLIFRVEGESIFLANFGEPELFYCTVRIFYSGAEFAKRLENFMKTQLFWEFRTEKKKYTLDRVFQTIYKHEYRKLVGGIRRAKVISSKYTARNVAIPACVVSKQRPAISLSIVPTVPDLDKSRAVKTFSPFSRKIAEAAGLRDNIASKRKLNFG